MTLTRRGRVVRLVVLIAVATWTSWNSPIGVPIAAALVVYGFTLIGRAFRLEPQPRRAGVDRGRRDRVAEQPPVRLGGSHCCACSVVCHHIGPVQLCAGHAGSTR